MLENEFEKIINESGGRINYDELPDAISSDYIYLKDRIETTISAIKDNFPQIKKISFDFINNYSFNAFAMGFDGEYFIGIHRGVMATLALLYDRFLADKDILKFIGDPEVETSDLPKIPNISLGYIKAVENLPLFTRPKDPIRRASVRLFVMLTLDFILAHELTHIIHGHVDYYIKELGLTLDELKAQNSVDSNSALIRKTMEMDADSGAVEMLLSSEIAKSLGYGPRPPGWDEIYDRPGMVLLQFSFIISIIFRIFGDQRLDQAAFEKAYYPEARLRFVISMLRISDLPAFKHLNEKVNYDLDKNNVPIHIGGGFNLIEGYFEKITGLES